MSILEREVSNGEHASAMQFSSRIWVADGLTVVQPKSVENADDSASEAVMQLPVECFPEPI
jgi:hypothetical protein